MSLPIITNRLVLRRFTYPDVQDIIQFVSHPSVARATSEIPATESGVRTYIDLQNSYQPFEQDKCFDLAIQHKGTNVIGLLSLVSGKHEQAAIGWALGMEYRGQGYATEGAMALIDYGFTSLGLHRIHATTSSSNTGSWKLMERLGMRREGHFREAEYHDGGWQDILVYGILASEWQPSGSERRDA